MTTGVCCPVGACNLRLFTARQPADQDVLIWHLPWIREPVDASMADWGPELIMGTLEEGNANDAQ